MKKIIIGISGLLILGFIAIRVVNAQNGTQDVKKTTTEAAMNCAKCPSIAACGEMKDSKKTEAKSCDPAKCKESKSDTTKCKANCSGSKTEMKKCDPAKCGGSGR